MAMEPQARVWRRMRRDATAMATKRTKKRRRYKKWKGSAEGPLLVLNETKYLQHSTYRRRSPSKSGQVVINGQGIAGQALGGQMLPTLGRVLGDLQRPSQGLLGVQCAAEAGARFRSQCRGLMSEYGVGVSMRWPIVSWLKVASVMMAKDGF